jgi:hypothetical protein
MEPGPIRSPGFSKKPGCRHSCPLKSQLPQRIQLNLETTQIPGSFQLTPLSRERGIHVAERKKVVHFRFFPLQHAIGGYHNGVNMV